MAVPHTTTPPLESGDHLSREEFHRRYLEHPEIARAELIEGVVFVSSPVGLDHGEPHGTVVGWLFAYRADTPEVGLADNTTVFLPTGDEVQPDACLYRLPPHGNVTIVERREGKRTTRYLEGTPDFVFEVAASSASYDLHSKKRAYERASAPEYVVWQVYEHRITWFRLERGRYVEIFPDENGVIESSGFPGLRLAVSKMIDGDYRGVLDQLVGHSAS